jgi:hypothetical protein
MTTIAKNSYLFIICLSITFCFTTCKKYPEDKFYSLKRPEKRVVGEWKVIEYNFNGNSVIAELNAKIKTYDIRNLTLKVVGKSGKTEGYCMFNPYYTSSYQDFPIDKTERSIFHFSYNHFANIDLGDSIKKLAFLSPLSLQGANYTNWDIRNLYKNKMHLQLKTDSGNYDIYFEK